MATEKQLKYWKSLKGKPTWNKGRKETRPEVLKRQSEGHKGLIVWNKGLKGVQKSHRKGLSMVEEYGYDQATKMKKHMSVSTKGKHNSPNTEFKKGNPAPMKGRKLSAERRKQMSEIRKGMFIGEKSPLWKGGKSKVDDLIRRMPEYKKWRQTVFERDNWTCQTCGKRGCYLEAHHIKHFKVILELYAITSITKARTCDDLWDISNGKTLCLTCHNNINHRRTTK